MSLEEEIKKEGIISTQIENTQNKLNGLKEEIKSQYSRVNELIANASIQDINQLIKNDNLTYHSALDGTKVVYFTIEKKNISQEIFEEVHVAYTALIQRGIPQEKQAIIGIFGEIINGKEERLKNLENKNLERDEWKYTNVSLSNLRVLAKDGDWKVE